MVNRDSVEDLVSLKGKMVPIPRGKKYVARRRKTNAGRRMEDNMNNVSNYLLTLPVPFKKLVLILFIIGISVVNGLLW